MNFLVIGPLYCWQPIKKWNTDYSRLSDEIDVVIASHPNGIYSNVTTGEFYAQSDEEFFEKF